MKANLLKTFAAVVCSIVFASMIHAQEKVSEYTANPVNLEELAKIADRLADRLTAEPLTTRGFINVYDNSDEAAKIKDVLSRKLEIKDRIIFYEPGIRYRFDKGTGIEFWLIPLGKDLPYPVFIMDCVCPTLSVEGRESTDEEYLTFTASVSGGSGETTTYNWKVSAGEIVEGQGTPVIRVAAKGAKEITAAVELGGVCEECVREDSFTSKIKSNLEMIDVFGYESSGQIRGRLDNLLKKLNENPKAKGYIINYASRADKNFLKTRQTQINEKFALRSKELTNRIIIIDGGYREDAQTELWISSDGIQKPIPTPTVDAKQIETKPAAKKSTRR